jgi:hypothetical protein
MADILIDNQALPTTPASGKTVLFVDSTTKKLAFVDDAGTVGGRLYHRASTASQSGIAVTDVYIVDSGLLIPSFGMKAGMVFRWWVGIDKTAAGTTAAILNIRVGAAQSTADTSRSGAMTQVVAQSGALCGGIMMVQAVVRNVGASGVLSCAWGFATGTVGLGSGSQIAASAYDNQAEAGKYMGLSVTSGTSAVWNILNVQGEIIG